MSEKVYISGPITGMKYLNKREFDFMESFLELYGFTPVNPFNIPCENKTWQGYMRADVAELVKCDRIYMLRGWWHSKGAIVELLIAKVLGMKIMFQG